MTNTMQRASSWMVKELDDAAEAVQAGDKSKVKPFQDIVHSLGGQRAKAMLSMSHEVDEKAFKKDCESLRARLKAQTHMLIRPRGKFIQYWDMTTGLALIYTLFVTPFEVGLDLPTKLDGLFMCNQVIALIFLTDICVQFFLPFPDPRHGEGAYERRHHKLAMRYFKGWFVLDVATIIPFDIFVLLGLLNGPVKGTKLLRILRLVKLLKVLKSSAIIERWQNSIAISSSKLTLMYAIHFVAASFPVIFSCDLMTDSVLLSVRRSYSFITIALLHLFSCGWCLLPTIQGSQRGEMGSIQQQVLQAALENRIDMQTSDGSLCTGCVSEDGSDASICFHPCLTTCEIETLAEVLGVSPTYVSNHEVWTCRAVAAGHFKPEAVFSGVAPVDIYVRNDHN